MRYALYADRKRTEWDRLLATRDRVTLDGVVCSGERSTSRWFCPRAIPSYWRECWLERVDEPESALAQHP